MRIHVRTNGSVQYTHNMEMCERFLGFADCSERADAEGIYGNIKRFLNKLGNVYPCLWLHNVMAQAESSLVCRRRCTTITQQLYTLHGTHTVT